MKIILLNGPPRSGKDTASLAIEEFLDVSNLPVIHEKLAWPNKAAFAAVWRARMDEDFNVEFYEEHKGEIVPEIGVSFRQFQIDFSEAFMKPRYGQNIFAKLLVGRIMRDRISDNQFVVVSDCGFQIEVDALIASQLFTDVLLIRCRREGCTYEGDSRQYVYLNGKPGVECDLQNSGTLDRWQGVCKYVVQGWLETSR